MDTRQTQTNVFTNGLNTDLHPLTTPNTVLTDCVNGTFITYNGNEFVLQNDMGNYPLAKAALPDGYIPIGVKEFGGILYIVSYNPIEKKSQIGSFPAPQQDFCTENTNKEVPNAPTNIFRNYMDPNNNNISYEELIKDEIFILYSSEDNFILNPGDDYCVLTDQKEYYFTAIEFYILTKEKQLIKIEEDEDKKVVTYSSIKDDKPFIPDDSYYRKVFWEIPGWLTYKIRIPYLDVFNIYLTRLIYSEITPTSGIDDTYDFTIDAQLIVSDPIFNKTSSNKDGDDSLDNAELKDHLYFKVKNGYKDGEDIIWLNKCAYFKASEVKYTNDKYIKYFYKEINYNSFDSEKVNGDLSKDDIKPYIDGVARINYISITPVIKCEYENNGEHIEKYIEYTNFTQQVELNINAISSDSIKLFTTYKYLVSDDGVTLTFTNEFGRLSQEGLDKFKLNIYYFNGIENSSQTLHFKKYAEIPVNLEKFGQTVHYIQFDTPNSDKYGFWKECICFIELTNGIISKRMPLITSELFNYFFDNTNNFNQIYLNQWISKLYNLIKINADLETSIAYTMERNEPETTEFDLKARTSDDNDFNDWLNQLKVEDKLVLGDSNTIWDKNANIPSYTITGNIGITVTAPEYELFGKKYMWQSYSFDTTSIISTTEGEEVTIQKETGADKTLSLSRKFWLNKSIAETGSINELERMYFYYLCIGINRGADDDPRPNYRHTTPTKDYTNEFKEVTTSWNADYSKWHTAPNLEVWPMLMTHIQIRYRSHEAHSDQSRFLRESLWSDYTLATVADDPHCYDYMWLESNKGSGKREWTKWDDCAVIMRNEIWQGMIRNNPFIIYHFVHDSKYDKVLCYKNGNVVNTKKDNKNSYVTLPLQGGKRVMIYVDDVLNHYIYDNYDGAAKDREIIDRIKQISQHLYITVPSSNTVYYKYLNPSDIKIEKIKDSINISKMKVEYKYSNFNIDGVKFNDFKNIVIEDGQSVAVNVSDVFVNNFNILNNGEQTNNSDQEIELYVAKSSNKNINEKILFNTEATIEYKSIDGNSDKKSTYDELQDDMYEIKNKFTTKANDFKNQFSQLQDIKPNTIYHDLNDKDLMYTGTNIIEDYNNFIKKWAVEVDSSGENKFPHPYIKQTADFENFSLDTDNDPVLRNWFYPKTPDILKLPTYDPHLGTSDEYDIFKNNFKSKQY